MSLLLYSPLYFQGQVTISFWIFLTIFWHAFFQVIQIIWKTKYQEDPVWNIWIVLWLIFLWKDLDQLEWEVDDPKMPIKSISNRLEILEYIIFSEEHKLLCFLSHVIRVYKTSQPCLKEFFYRKKATKSSKIWKKCNLGISLTVNFKGKINVFFYKKKDSNGAAQNWACGDMEWNIFFSKRYWFY